MSLLRGVLIGLTALVALLSLGACAYLQHPRFGTYPAGERLEVIQRSPHFVDGAFRNLVATPILADDSSYLSVVASYLLQRVKNLRPDIPTPATKTDLKALDAGQDTVVWLGHSSFFVLLAGKRILIDPVFSPFAAPVSFSGRAFEGTNLYTAGDMPQLDVLLITHDHWDHLDHATVTALESKVRRAFVPLGVGAHFEYWGYARDKIHEGDWFESLQLDGLVVHAVPARHYSGRWLTRNKTLWAGFVLESDKRRLLFSGDTGYGPHFEELARRFDGFDLVALDMGQYDARWPYIHMTPEEAARAAEKLQTRALLPAHVGRFSLGRHAWDEPFDRITAASEAKPYRLLTPAIGEPVIIDHEELRFARWWDGAQGIASSSDIGRSP
jgi:L-ascorbate metabolism protein UlaG (beta-lactamase superfamily)